MSRILEKLNVTIPTGYKNPEKRYFQIETPSAEKIKPLSTDQCSFGTQKDGKNSPIDSIMRAPEVAKERFMTEIFKYML